MKRTIRFGTFETNSSSVHALTMCSEEDYEKWLNGELLYGHYQRELVPIDDINDEDYPYPEDYDIVDKSYLTEHEFWERESEYYEVFRHSFTTENGETVIAFGYYGHD